MLEKYFVRPETVDRIRASWIGEAIEAYVRWLTEEGYASRTVCRRVPILMQFGEFASARGLTSCRELPSCIDEFAYHWLRAHGRNCRSQRARDKLADEARNPIRQMLRVVLPGYAPKVRRDRPIPFVDDAPGFIAYLRNERGLSDATIRLYEHHLRSFAAYLSSVDLHDLADLSPPVVSAFIANRSRALARTGVRDMSGMLRVFVGYLYRERLIPRDFSSVIESPRSYRLSSVPRSVTWEEVRVLLEAVDRRSAIGKRDYAMLLLLVSYGLRAHEVAGLTLGDVNWEEERLFVRSRKGGHSTAYPLSPVVGEALIAYIRNGRPETSDRHIFFRSLPPWRPIKSSGLSCRTSHLLRKAGISVGRPGTHTLRHTCVQRLVDAGLGLKVIGDYVGHRSPDTTQIYAKVATTPLRDVALAGEDVL